MSCSLLSKEKFAELSGGRSLSSVNRDLKAGRVAFVKIAGRVVIPFSELERIAGLACPGGAVAPVVAESVEAVGR